MQSHSSNPAVCFQFALEGKPSILSIEGDVESLLGFRACDLEQNHPNLASRIHPDDQDIAENFFSPNTLAFESSCNLRLRHADGKIRCLRIFYSKWHENNQLRLELILQDAKVLQQQQEIPPIMDQMRSLLENTDDYVYFKDRNHVFTAASQSLVLLTDPADHWTDLLGCTDYDVFPEEYADIYYRLEKRIFDGQASAQEIQKILRKDGSHGWVDNRKYPIHDQNGNVVGLFGIARDISEIKSIEEALSESEQRFRSIFEQVPMISVQGYNRDRKVIFWNRASEALYGYRSDEALGKPLEELIIPDAMRPAVVAQISDWIAGGPAIAAAELTLQDATKQPVEVYSSHVMLHNRQGEPEMYCIDIDIAERKHYAEALFLQQQFSQSILDNLPGIFYLYSYPEMQLVLWNKRHETLLGYRTEEMAARHVTDWFSPAIKDHILKTVHDIVEYGQSSIEAPLLTREGKEIQFALTGVRFERAGKCYFMGIGTDITERKRMEEALRLSEERHRLLADNASDVIWTMDFQGHFTYVSPSIKKLRGFTSAEVMQQTLDEVLTPQSAAIGKELLRQAIQAIHTGVPIPEFRGELEQPCKDGSTIWTEVTTAGLKNAAGEYISILGVTRDITQRKQMEEQVQQLAFHDSLTGLPNRRLLNDRLSQAIVNSKRTGRFSALMFLDLDNFKPLNDQHGHEIGDLLLIEAARRLCACVREVDTVARFGGDEFVVLINELEQAELESGLQAGVIAEKIRLALMAPYLLDSPEPSSIRQIHHYCTASIGVVLFQGQQIRQDSILKWADMAMYRAKERGNSVVQFASTATCGGISSLPAQFLQLTWTPAYECGAPLIDRQHRALFSDACLLLEAVLSEHPLVGIETLLHGLINDISQHFQDEEALFFAANFPGAARHHEEHLRLLGKAQQLLSRFNTQTLDLGELFQFLIQDVVVNHMLHMDRLFFPCLKKHQQVEDTPQAEPAPHRKIIIN